MFRQSALWRGRPSAFHSFLSHLRRQHTYGAATTPEEQAAKLRLAARMWRKMNAEQRKAFTEMSNTVRTISPRAIARSIAAKQDAAAVDAMAFNNFNVLLSTLHLESNGLSAALPSEFIIRVAKETLRCMNAEQIAAMRAAFHERQQQHQEQPATVATATAYSSANPADTVKAIEALLQELPAAAEEPCLGTAAGFLRGLLLDAQKATASGAKGTVVRPRPVFDLIAVVPSAGAAPFCAAVAALLPRVEVKADVAAGDPSAPLNGARSYLVKGRNTASIVRLAQATAPRYFPASGAKSWTELSAAQFAAVCDSWAAAFLLFVQLHHCEGKLHSLVRRHGLNDAALDIFAAEFFNGLTPQQRNATNLFIGSVVNGADGDHEAVNPAVAAFEEFVGASMFVTSTTSDVALPIIAHAASFVGLERRNSRLLPSAHPALPDVLPPSAAFSLALPVAVETAEFWRLVLFFSPQAKRIAPRPFDRARVLLDFDLNSAFASGDGERGVAWFVASAFLSAGTPRATVDVYSVRHIDDMVFADLVRRVVDNDVLPGQSIYEKAVQLSLPHMTAPQRAYHLRRQLHQLGQDGRPQSITDVTRFYTVDVPAFAEGKLAPPANVFLLNALDEWVVARRSAPNGAVVVSKPASQPVSAAQPDSVVDDEIGANRSGDDTGSSTNWRNRQRVFVSTRAAKCDEPTKKKKKVKRGKGKGNRGKKGRRVLRRRVAARKLRKIVKRAARRLMKRRSQHAGKK